MSCPPLPGRCSDREGYPGGTGGLVFRKNLNYILATELEWPGAGKTSLEDSIVRPGKSLFFPRGTYRVLNHVLKIGTWNGFFEMRIQGDSGGTLTVFPAESVMDQALPGRRNQAPEKPAWLSWMKDRELFEARPYSPGDDPRRINWKMLALHDELFIKEGSSLSPSRKSALLVLDTRGGRSAVDRLFRHLSSLIESLGGSGMQIDALFPSRELFNNLEKLTRREKEDLLASIPPDTAAPSLKGAGGPYGVVYFFSAVVPGADIQRVREECFPEANRILVLPRGSARRSRGPEYTPEGRGWICVRP